LGSYVGAMRKQGILAQIAAIFLGASISSAIGFWLVTEVVRAEPYASVLLVASYVLFAIFYSVGASLTFQPKRFVSPTHIQIVTAPMMVMVVIDTIYRTSRLAWDPFQVGYVIILGATLFFLVIVADTFLSPAARYLVGLLGTKDDLIITQYLVHAHWTKVLAEFTDRDFQYALHITEQEEIRRDMWLLRTHKDSVQQMYVVICPDSEDRKLTQVVVVSYELAEYGIAPTTRARATHELKTKSIIDRLRKLKVVEVKQKKRNLLPGLTIAYENALACTESKILTIGKLPTRHKAIITATALILIVVGVLGYLGRIGPDFAETAILFIGIALVFEFFPLVAVKRGSRPF
jgi:hypothetical protein